MNDDTSNLYHVKPGTGTAQVYDDINAENHSGMGKQYPLPGAVEGWSWGAFMWVFFWAVGNRVWIALLPLALGLAANIFLLNTQFPTRYPETTVLGIAIFLILMLMVQITLGIKGRKWAWQRKRWKNIAHFNRVQRRWSMLALLILLPAIAGIVGWAFYEENQFRTHKLPLLNATISAITAAREAGDYMQEHAAIPATLEQAGVSADLPDQIGKLRINPASAEISVTMNEGSSKGKSFIMAPSFTNEGEIEWRCLAGEIEPSLLTPTCRHNVAEKVTVFPTRLQGLAALQFAESVGQTLAQHMELPHKVPKSLQQAGIDVELPETIKAISLEANGALRVTLNIAAVQGKSFILMPTQDMQKNITWECVNWDIDYLLMPPNCQRAKAK